MRDAVLEFVGMLALTVAILAGLFVLVSVVACGVDKITMPATRARYEALSAAATLAKCGENEDIMGKVADWNVELAKIQATNKIPVVSWFVADEYDSLRTIPIEGCAR